VNEQRKIYEEHVKYHDHSARQISESYRCFSAGNNTKSFKS